mmetsp:Transcript_35615/g.88595  ORF Transcript_35615/g.88595 Transcript_35615/m.88595 type:complete len:221 (+) Transcript_35615:866-1528(+)
MHAQPGILAFLSKKWNELPCVRRYADGFSFPSTLQLWGIWGTPCMLWMTPYRLSRVLMSSERPSGEKDDVLTARTGPRLHTGSLTLLRSHMCTRPSLPPEASMCASLGLKERLPTFLTCSRWRVLLLLRRSATYTSPRSLPKARVVGEATSRAVTLGSSAPWLCRMVLLLPTRRPGPKPLLHNNARSVTQTVPSYDAVATLVLVPSEHSGTSHTFAMWAS